jgi:3-oxoadipate enol-lactonase
MPTTIRPDTGVYWEEHGSGDALVVLHGLGGDIGFWGAHLPAFADRFRVIAIDLRGSGRTPASPGGHEIADLADDVAAVLDDAGVDRAHVFGFSMGGYVAQSFAVRHAERLDRLVLGATSARLNGQIGMFVDAVLDSYESGIGPARMFDLIAPFLFSIPFVEDPANAPFFEYPEDDPFEQTLGAWRELYLAQRRFDGRDALGSIAAPTLVMVGSEDRFVAVPEARAFADAIRGSRLVVYPGLGHLINVEAQQRFEDDVMTFLTSPSPRSAA